MFRSLVKFVIVLVPLQILLSAIVIADESKQTSFGDVKLGTKANSLGFKLDDFRAWYEYKNKYFLTGDFGENGHPINQIELNCSKANKTDMVGGISCYEKSEDIRLKFGKSIVERCDKDEPSEWKDFVYVNILYNNSTNQFWRIDSETGKILAIGIS